MFNDLVYVVLAILGVSLMIGRLVGEYKRTGSIKGIFFDEFEIEMIVEDDDE